MSYKELANDLVTKCIGQGADAAEVYLQESRNLSIEVRNGDTETIQETSSHGVGIRVFVKSKMAFAHCNDFSRSLLVVTTEQRSVAVVLETYQIPLLQTTAIHQTEHKLE